MENNKQILSFIHIPKNAGTSIEVLGNKYGYKWGHNSNAFKKYNITEKSEILKDLAASSVWHIPPKFINNNKGFDVYFKNTIPFCVVRNPYSRIISEYNYYERIHKNIPPKDLNTFISEIQSKLDNDFCHFGCHLLPENEYTYVPINDSWEQQNEDNKQIEIIKFENLQKEFEQLMIKYQIPIKKKLPHKLKFDSSVTINDLTSKSIKIINNIYKDDFINFNYDLIS